MVEAGNERKKRMEKLEGRTLGSILNLSGKELRQECRGEGSGMVKVTASELLHVRMDKRRKRTSKVGRRHLRA